MICEQCGKRPASVHITRVENGKKNRYALMRTMCDAKESVGL